MSDLGIVLESTVSSIDYLELSGTVYNGRDLWEFAREHVFEKVLAIKA